LPIYCFHKIHLLINQTPQYRAGCFNRQPPPDCVSAAIRVCAVSFFTIPALFAHVAFLGFRRFLEGFVGGGDGGPAFGSFAFHQFLNHVKLDALLFILFASSGPFPTFGVS